MIGKRIYMKVIAFTGAMIYFLSLTGLAAQEKSNVGPPQFINGIAFAKFIDTNGYRDSLRSSIISFEKEFGPCSSATIKSRRTVVIPKVPVNFPGEGEVPQWVEVMDMKGCEKAFLRAVVVGKLSSTIKFLPLVPGTGISGVIEQWDVIKSLIPAEKNKAEKAGCTKDDKVRIKSHDLVSKANEEGGLAWKEDWKLVTCKGPKSVQIAFKTDSSGKTSFQISE